MDITARLAEARKVTSLFPKFGSAGYDAYDKCAPMLFDFIDGTDAEWRDALDGAIVTLGGLNAQTEPEQWLDRAEGERISAEIRAIYREFTERVKREHG